MRGALDPERMLVTWELHRPARLQPRVDEEFRSDSELEGGMTILRMGPDGVAAHRLSDRISHHVKHANLMLAEADGGLAQIIHVPGDGMKVLSVASVEFPQRGFFP